MSGEEVTEDMLEQATTLFSNNYGVWGAFPTGQQARRTGNRVKISAARLRAQCLPVHSNTAYAQVTIGGELAGHAFACRWTHLGRQVLWITQLVVHRKYRERRLATTLLLSLFDEKDEVFGIMSSHPAACKALVKAFGDLSLANTSLDFARNHAAGVISQSPIGYIRDAEIVGRLFHPEDNSGMVVGANSQFFVDHAEPLEALSVLQEEEQWPLGQLPDGHEFLFIFEREPLRRSRSSSSRRSPGRH
ncbi:hypothetical protein SODALDRAFT_330601 [Sodiomyces alkalinus F11]|uniref:N-acetyltransferase domain-containing protein n=1 Tax=Sodiomyces alkalinus (strain CBS 110278 / VKM F-3762 / F11) TaxID=1314773 RepID=A0A3N2Q2N1_SODAK|nr:hypothetical protein SODALDRAFT_330601 [Sodiomyces alkalinus F11]ROT40875.1 hypothetical protein SODALDRAFT_330601 [Sodiomyces alkalinus F11]